MDKALNFSEHISSKINKANRNLGLIFRIFTYEGCPSKSWTFVITRDWVEGIL